MASSYARKLLGQGRDIVLYIDVYEVLLTFGVTCPAVQHAVKKLLCAGQRGHKTVEQDLLEAREAICRAIDLNAATTKA